MRRIMLLLNVRRSRVQLIGGTDSYKYMALRAMKVSRIIRMKIKRMLWRKTMTKTKERITVRLWFTAMDRVLILSIGSNVQTLE